MEEFSVKYPEKQLIDTNDLIRSPDDLLTFESMKQATILCFNEIFHILLELQSG